MSSEKATRTSRVTRNKKNLKDLEAEEDSTFHLNDGKELQENTPKPSIGILLTPRRTSRKSIKIKPSDYEEIIVRSAKKDHKNNDAINEVNDEQSEEPPQPRWNLATVGRSSNRRTRKSHRTGNKKKQHEETEEDDDKMVEKSAKDKDEKIKLVTAEEKQEKAKDATFEADEEQPAKNATFEADEEKSAKNATFEADEGKTAKNATFEADEEKSAKNATFEADEEKTAKNATFEADECAKDATFEADKEKTAKDATFEADEEKTAKNATFEADEQKTTDIPSSATAELIVKEIVVTKEPIINATVVTEDQIVNEMIKEDDQKKEDDEKDHFGKYLKSTNVFMDDLGLIPLHVDETELDENEPKATEGKKQTDEESMPPLQLIEDDDDETFNASDCIFVASFESEQQQQNDNDDACSMQTLLVSDDENNEQTVSSPKKKELKVVSSIQAEASIVENIVTPKRQREKPYRFPTPYKAQHDISLNTAETLATKEEEKMDVTIAVTTLEPKENRKRGIRKRSFQENNLMVADENVQKNRVTFYSPNNQTTSIEEVDKRIAQSARKLATKRIKNDENVNKRRRRSKSYDSAIKKMPSRIRLPNFAAIHQKNFDEMENIVDHVARKNERAKIISLSTSKIRSESAQKAVTRKDLISEMLDKPKASKKIQLDSGIKSTITGKATPSKLYTFKGVMTKKDPTATASTLKASTATTATAPTATATTSTSSTATTATTSHIPKMIPIIPIIPVPLFPIDIKTTATTPTNNHKFKFMSAQKTPKNILKPTNTWKPPFSLSTNVPVEPPTFMSSINPAVVNATTTLTSKPKQNYEDKIAARRQRHMQMFKGRSAQDRVGLSATARNAANIRGVRSNRRFELLMQHRNNLDQ